MTEKMIDEKLLEILACPRCESRPPLELRGNFLVCTECRYAYRIVEGIPHLLIEEALSEREWKKELGERDA